MDGLVPTTAVVKWEPDLGVLPEGWYVRSVRIEVDYMSRKAEVQLMHADGYHLAELVVLENTPPVMGWLHAYLVAIAAVPHATQVYIDCPRDVRSYWGRYT